MKPRLVQLQIWRRIACRSKHAGLVAPLCVAFLALNVTCAGHGGMRWLPHRKAPPISISESHSTPARSPHSSARKSQRTRSAVGGIEVRPRAEGRTSTTLAEFPALGAAVLKESRITNTTASANYVTFVFDERDSLSAISGACSTSPQALLKLNRLRYDQLRSGQVLRIPRLVGLESTSPLARILDPEEQATREIWRGVRGKRAIALTFDAGGEADGARELIDFLAEAHVPATFFVTGQFAQRFPDVVRLFAAHGFPVHNHSWSHHYFTKLSKERIRWELTKTDDLITTLTGRSTHPFWRPPFGDRNRAVLRSAAECGFQSVYWTLDSLDSYGELKTSEFILRRVLDPPAARGAVDDYLDGAIVLMHVGEPATVRALPAIVEGLRSRGFCFVSLEEILTP